MAFVSVRIIPLPGPWVSLVAIFGVKEANVSAIITTLVDDPTNLWPTLGASDSFKLAGVDQHIVRMVVSN